MSVENYRGGSVCVKELRGRVAHVRDATIRDVGDQTESEEHVEDRVGDGVPDLVPLPRPVLDTGLVLAKAGDEHQTFLARERTSTSRRVG